MPEVDISGNEYTVYADVDAADEYLAASTHAANWTAATDDEKAQALVTATRLLDRQRWKDEYDTFEERVEVEKIVWASIELALALLDGTAVQTDANTSQKIESLRAGSVAISYFRGAEGSVKRFPLIVHELIRDYLIGSSLALSGVATGVDGETITDQDFSLTRPI